MLDQWLDIIVGVVQGYTGSVKDRCKCGIWIDYWRKVQVWVQGIWTGGIGDQYRYG